MKKSETILSALVLGVLPLAIVAGYLWYRQTPRAVLARLASSDAADQCAAIALLVKRGDRSDGSLAGLRACLAGRNSGATDAAIDALLVLDEPRKAIVDGLVAAMRSQPPGPPFVTNGVHACAAIALGHRLEKLLPEATAAIPALILLLDEGYSRAFAVNTLGEFGPRAAEALPKLRELLAAERNPQAGDGPRLRQAIQKIEGTATPVK